jgi:uncharacterized protein (TIGR03086 family)
MTDLRELHEKALALAVDLVAQVGPDDLRRPTPCAGWSLAELLGHMIGQHRGFAAAVRGLAAPAEAFLPVRFDPVAWHASVRELGSAFAAADVTATAVVVELSSTPLPMEQLVAAQLIDTVVHTWDIAQALGVDFTPPPDLRTATAAIAAALPDRAYGPGRAFSAPLPCDGDTWQQTLALVGRRADTAVTTSKE